VRRALALQPDSVTIYQMELPYNTVISQEIIKQGAASPIADWNTNGIGSITPSPNFRARVIASPVPYTLATTNKPAALSIPTLFGMAAI